MLTLILIFLIFLWLFGFISFPLTNIILFTAVGKAVTLNDLLLFLVILWLIDILPYPFRAIATVLLLLWLLAIFGIIVIGNFSNIVMIALIIGLIAYIFKWH